MDSEGEMVKTRLVFIQPWAWIIGVAWALWMMPNAYVQLLHFPYDYPWRQRRSVGGCA